jgi:hypothetical protein
MRRKLEILGLAIHTVFMLAGIVADAFAPTIR